MDARRRPGRWLLTGSANLLSLPAVADSLAGRMEALTLHPLSRGELAARRDDFAGRLFADRWAPAAAAPRLDARALAGAMAAGGYPDAVARPPGRRRAAWFESYHGTLLERDVRDVARLQDRTGLARLVHLLAARSGTLRNAAEMGRSAGLNAVTLARYLEVLETLFLFWRLPAWPANLGKRLAKAPKLHMTDSGLACFLRGLDPERLLAGPDAAGRLLESFVASELARQASWSRRGFGLSHCRPQSGDEVDLVLEDRAGRVAAVEVKNTGTLSSRDAKGLAALRGALGGRFVRGVVLYTGHETVPLGDRLLALPLGELWGRAADGAGKRPGAATCRPPRGLRLKAKG